MSSYPPHSSYPQTQYYPSDARQSSSPNIQHYPTKISAPDYFSSPNAQCNPADFNAQYYPPHPIAQPYPALQHYDPSPESYPGAQLYPTDFNAQYQPQHPNAPQHPGHPTVQQYPGPSNAQQYPGHSNAQHYHPSPASYPGTQPSPAVDVPQPYIAQFTRLDAALPPKYTYTWADVRNDAQFFPAIFTKSKGAFKKYLEASLVRQPQWFQDLESKPSDAKKLLWPDVEYMSCHHISDNMHWSLRLLRYQLRVGQKTFEKSTFAGMIVFEIIFVVLTPYPENWPNGLWTIEMFTDWPSKSIEKWFAERRTHAANSLESDAETKCIIKEVRVGRGGKKQKFPIRKDALDHIANNARGMRWDSTSFRYCLGNLLQSLADARLPKYCTYVLDRSYLPD